jgi:hypothetical protein
LPLSACGAASRFRASLPEARFRRVPDQADHTPPRRYFAGVATQGGSSSLRQHCQDCNSDSDSDGDADQYPGGVAERGPAGARSPT